MTQLKKIVNITHIEASKIIDYIITAEVKRLGTTYSSFVKNQFEKPFLDIHKIIRKMDIQISN